MKKLLTILFVFASFLSFGQATKDSTKLQKIPAYGYWWEWAKANFVTIGYDTVSLKAARSIAIVPDGMYFKPTDAGAWEKLTDGGSGAAEITVLPTIAALQATSVSQNLIFVSDSLRGGLFSYISSSTANDGGIYFTATGKGSGSWQRQFDYGSGIDVRWFPVKGDAFTDDHDGLVQAIDVGNVMQLPIFIPSNFVVATTQLSIADKSYVHFKSNGATFKALNGASGSNSSMMLFTNITKLTFEGVYTFNGNYPTASNDYALRVLAPVGTSSLSVAGSSLDIGVFYFSNLPLNGVNISVSDALYMGYENIFIKEFNCVNASNKRNVSLATNFGYLNIRGAHTNVNIGRLYLRQDNEVWGDNNQSPNCKMFQFSAESDTIYPQMKSLNIENIFADYPCSMVSFFQSIDDVTIGRMGYYNTLKKPGVADSLAYSNILTKAWSFTKFDYALPNRSLNRVKVGSFVMANTTSVIQGGSTFFVGLWIDEGLEDMYVDQIDSDVRCQFHGTGSTTQISGKHIINSLTYRATSRPNTSIIVTNRGTIINTLKLINSNASYTFKCGTIGNIIQEGSLVPSLLFDASSSDTTNVTSDGEFSGTAVLNGNLVNALVYLQIHWTTAVWNGSPKSFGYKYYFNNIHGGATLVMQLFKDAVNITPASYDGFFETQMKNYYELQMNNCEFKLDQTTTLIAYRFFLSKPVFLQGKDLSATSAWEMPLKDNKFNNTYLASTASTDFYAYPYNTNTKSRIVTGALPQNTLYDYEFIVDNNGANRTQTLGFALNTAGKKYRYVKNVTDAYTITLSAQSGETINGGATYVIPVNGQAFEFESDGISNWVLNYATYNLSISTTGSDITYADGILHVPSASATARGVVTASGTQEFAGRKDIIDGLLYVGSNSVINAVTNYNASSSLNFAGIGMQKNDIPVGRLGYNSTDEFEFRMADAAGSYKSYIPFMIKRASGNVAIGVLANGGVTSNLQVSQSTQTFGTVSVTATSGTVTGTLTQFLNTFKVGDQITANSETHTITAIASDLSMTTDVWTNTASGVTYTDASGGNRFMVKGNGRVGIGTTTPSAFLQIVAGTAIAGQAPLKLTAGTNLTTPEAGAVEFDGTHFYGTVGSTRYQLDQQSPGGTPVTSVSGTALQIGSTGGTTPVISLVSGGTLPGAWDLGTPASMVATNVTGTATGLTSGITNALKSATTTVDVSAATAPSNGQILVATSSTTATWQTLAAGVTIIDSPEHTYASTIAWTAGTAPSGSTNHTYQWTRVGKMVTVRVNLRYTVAGVTCTAVVFDLPSDCPTPAQPAGTASNSAALYWASGAFAINENTTVTAPVARMRNNSTNTGFQWVITGTSASAQFAYVTCSYFVP